MNNTQEGTDFCCGNKSFFYLNARNKTPLFEIRNGAFAMFGGRAEAMKSFLLRILFLKP